MVIEINLIAEKLERKVFFEAKSRYVYAEQYKADDLLDLNALKKGQVYIKVSNYEEGEIYSWSLPKFENRYNLIKDVLENYFASGILQVFIV